MAEPIRVLIADDHLLLRDGIAVLIANCDDIVVVGQAENGREAIAAHRTLRPDVHARWISSCRTWMAWT